VDDRKNLPDFQAVKIRPGRNVAGAFTERKLHNLGFVARSRHFRKWRVLRLQHVVQMHRFSVWPDWCQASLHALQIRPVSRVCKSRVNEVASLIRSDAVDFTARPESRNNPFDAFLRRFFTEQPLRDFIQSAFNKALSDSKRSANNHAPCKIDGIGRIDRIQYFFAYFEYRPRRIQGLLPLPWPKLAFLAIDAGCAVLRSIRRRGGLRALRRFRA
jgi:hypothetical protein